MIHSRRKFTQTQMHYLRMLPAVANVTSSRITYSDEFRDAATARYLRGDSPVRIFRDAGLDPKLIGYKRIERAFARWKGRERVDALDEPAGEDSTERELEPASPDDRRRDMFPAATYAAKAADSGNGVGGAQGAEEAEVGGNDLRDRLIVEQALCIARLEERIKELEQELALPQSVADVLS